MSEAFKQMAWCGAPLNWFQWDMELKSLGRVITHMITLKGIYGREMFETWYLMSSMLASSEVFKAAVSSVITHRFPADQWADGFAAARSGDCGKVVLDWS